MAEIFKFESYNVTLESSYGTFTLPFDDAEFVTRYYVAGERCQSCLNEMQERLKSLEKEDVVEVAKISAETAKFIASELDGAIGEGTMKAVFGDIIPNVDALNRFMQALIPYFEKYQQKRTEYTSKYSANRMGGSE